MPKLSIWTIRISFLYLLLGFTLGALLLTNKGVPIHPALWQWLPVHVEFLLFGWVVQFVMGVAFYIAPRFWKAPRRGNEAGAKAAVMLLNGGIWMAAVGPVLSAPAIVMVVGRMLEAGAAVAFATHLWFRIVSRDLS